MFTEPYFKNLFERYCKTNRRKTAINKAFTANSLFSKLQENNGFSGKFNFGFIRNEEDIVTEELFIENLPNSENLINKWSKEHKHGTFEEPKKGLIFYHAYSKADAVKFFLQLLDLNLYLSGKVQEIKRTV